MFFTFDLKQVLAKEMLVSEAAVRRFSTKISLKGLQPAILLKKRLRQRCFPVNFEKLFRTPFS